MSKDYLVKTKRWLQKSLLNLGQIWIFTTVSKNSLLIFGLLLGVIASVAYFFYGYQTVILNFWLLAILLIGFYFYFKEYENIKKINLFDKKDLLIIIILFLIFSPLYFAFIYIIPSQISTDEVVIGSISKELINNYNADIFGLSNHFGNPNLIFYLWGHFAKLIGGVDLLHIRLIHAFSGLIIIILSYLFFRTLSLPKTYSVGGAVIMGSQHALLAISRMAMRDNTPLLIELIALIFFYVGWKHKSLFYAFLGGVVTGFSFYTYFPARIILILWLLFLIVCYIFIWSKQEKRTVPKFVLVVSVGFLIVAMPVILATFKSSPSVALGYQKSQLIIFPEGRELQKEWIGSPTIADGVKENFVNGLFMFVKNLHDQGYIYSNYGNGFIDPLTRILLWLGVITVLVKLIFKKQPEKKEEDLLALSSFLFLWLFFTFLTTRNPNYTRLLIILPFIVYLVLAAIKEIINFFSKISEKFFLKNKIYMLTKISFYLFFLIIISIAVWNLVIYKNYVIVGFQDGNSVGGTGRYVEGRKNFNNYTFLLAADDQYSYFGFGVPSWWIEWTKFFTSDGQKVEIINPQDLFSKEKVRTLCHNQPFTLFLSETLYSKIKDNLITTCRFYKVYNIKPDGSLLALEFID